MKSRENDTRMRRKKSHCNCSPDASSLSYCPFMPFMLVSLKNRSVIWNPAYVTHFIIQF